MLFAMILLRLCLVAAAAVLSYFIADFIAIGNHTAEGWVGFAVMGAGLLVILLRLLRNTWSDD